LCSGSNKRRKVDFKNDGDTNTWTWRSGRRHLQQVGGARAREVVEGRFKLNMKPRKLKPLKEFFKIQGRFRHLTDEQIAETESRIHDRWQKLLVRHERGY